MMRDGTVFISDIREGADATFINGMLVIVHPDYPVEVVDLLELGDHHV